jgi:2-dehydropantoate 2-reductase
VLEVRPTVITDPLQAQPVDWVLVATKAYDVVATAAWLRALRRHDTPVAVVQNGVEHVQRFAPHVPAGFILPVMIDCPVERERAGVIRQRGPGRMAVPRGALGAAFAELFAHTRLEVTQPADFTTTLWKKLCINSVGAISAVLAKPAGIVRHPGVVALMRAVLRECIAVGRAEGAQLGDELVEEVIAAQRAAPPDASNSLHADRLAGRPMEIDARNGAIVRIGARHGIATPVNRMLVDLLEAVRDY